VPGSLISRFDAALFDLDGVCYLGPVPVVHAPEIITRVVSEGVLQAYVTNNASRTPEEVASHLVSIGISATPESVVTSASVACEMLSGMVPQGARVLVIGTQALRDEVAKVGLTMVESSDDNPAAVIHGFTPDLNWEWMSEAALAIRKGAIYFATNMDRTIPRDRGLMVGNGSMVLAIANSTGVKPYSAGKPEPEIFRIAARRIGAERPLAVGDNLNTDIQGAVAAGIPSLHVLTGLATAREVVLAVPEQRPTYLADDMRALVEHYPSQVWDGPWAVSGAARVRWGQDGFVTATGALDGKLDLDTYRALARAAWRAFDEGVSSETIAQATPELEVVR
jgi:HAD superfamily hydrolase (TIGR01450 family)